MLSNEIKIRVRYGETDQMGYVYYGNYAQYYEVGRVELLRKFGMSYKAMEESGVMLPVVEYKTKYIRPAFYDDELTIKTAIPSLPSAKILFHYECYNEAGVLLNQGETTLVFIDMASKRPCRAPENFISAISSYFES